MGPGGIQNPVKTYKNQVTPSYWYDFTEERKPMPSYWSQVRGERNGVPVSMFLYKLSTRKPANWPNSAGMGPGAYKTQSKHTKIKSRHRTGTIWLRNTSLCLNIEGKSGWGTSSTLAFQIAVTQVKFADVPNTLKWVLRHRFWGLYNELPHFSVLCVWRTSWV